MKRTQETLQLNNNPSKRQKEERWVLPFDIWETIFPFLVESEYDFVQFLKISSHHYRHFDTPRFREHVIWQMHFGRNEPLQRFIVNRACDIKRVFIGWQYNHGPNNRGYDFEFWHAHVDRIIGKTKNLKHLKLYLTDFTQPIILHDLDYLSVDQSVLNCTVTGMIKKLYIEELNREQYEILLKSMNVERKDFMVKEVWIRPPLDRFRGQTNPRCAVDKIHIEMAEKFLGFLEIGSIEKLTLDREFLTDPDFPFDNFYGKVEWYSMYASPLQDYENQKQSAEASYQLEIEKLNTITKRLQCVQPMSKGKTKIND